jgi:hypothetical protein
LPKTIFKAEQMLADDTSCDKMAAVPKVKGRFKLFMREESKFQRALRRNTAHAWLGKELLF